ncbi:hypothetical protein QOT17_002637 [Balamuthia mandrillaris]
MKARPTGLLFWILFGLVVSSVRASCSDETEKEDAPTADKGMCFPEERYDCEPPGVRVKRLIDEDTSKALKETGRAYFYDDGEYDEEEEELTFESNEEWVAWMERMRQEVKLERAVRAKPRGGAILGGKSFVGIKPVGGGWTMGWRTKKKPKEEASA